LAAGEQNEKPAQRENHNNGNFQSLRAEIHSGDVIPQI
jgi:hypothetical protein